MDFEDFLKKIFSPIKFDKHKIIYYHLGTYKCILALVEDSFIRMCTAIHIHFSTYKVWSSLNQTLINRCIATTPIFFCPK